MNDIVYFYFERWYKKRVANVIPVKIVDRDNLFVPLVDSILYEEFLSSDTDTSIQRFEIPFSNGLEIRHGEIDCWSFHSLVG